MKRLADPVTRETALARLAQGRLGAPALERAMEATFTPCGGLTRRQIDTSSLGRLVAPLAALARRFGTRLWP